MDIERLTARNKNGLAYLVKVKPNEQEVDSPYENTLKCILDCFERLAQYEEAEIANQSVVAKSATSEEVERAIDWLETGDFEIIAGDEEYTANSSHHPNTSRFRKTAITALQAYQPTTRKNRIVEEVAISKTETTSCEWCEIASACEYEVTFFKNDDRWATERSLLPKYCPNCGRKIKED